MKRFSVLVIVGLLLALPNILWSASLYNSDGRPHEIKARLIGGAWIRTTVYSRGTRYFSCIYGCEIIVLETGSSVTLESDADIVISDGILRLR